MSPDEELRAALRSCQLEVIGLGDTEDASVLRTAAALAKAFASEPGCLFFEPHDPRGAANPPDLLLVTPSVGVLSIEVKGFAIDEIQSAKGGTMVVSLGKHIDTTAMLEKNLSRAQQDLSRADFRARPQLIRGVAGSGKSVVLANNVARRITRAHRQVDLWQPARAAERIAVVCYNRALVPFLRSKIEIAVEEQAPGSAAAAELTVAHFNALMFQLSTRRGGPLEYVHVEKLSDEEVAARYLAQCDELGDQLAEHQLDAIYVDEAQDFSDDQLRVLLRLIRPDRETNERNIVLFYDDAQNVYARPRPTWKDIGIDVGKPRRRRPFKLTHGALNAARQ